MTQQQKEELAKQIDALANDERFKDNWKIYKDFPTIAKMIALQYGILDMPEIMKVTKLKPFGRSEHVLGTGRRLNNTITTKAYGFAWKRRDKFGIPYKQRVIGLNPFIDERNSYDFKDFMVNDSGVASQKDFDTLRKEEVTNGNKVVENWYFGNANKEMLKTYISKQENPTEDLESQIKKDYTPVVRLKRQKTAQLFKALENDELKSLTTKKQSRYEEKSTVVHEFLHEVSKSKSNYSGGVNTFSRNMLYEGMTEWLCFQVIKEHKEWFLDSPKQKPTCFEDYKPFVAYADIMNTIFPGSVEDIYFNGKQSVEKYKFKTLKLQGLIDMFSPIEFSDYMMQDDPFKLKQENVQHIIKNLLNIKHSSQELLKKNKISQNQFDRVLKDMQICFDGVNKNNHLDFKFDFKTRDLPFGKNELKRQLNEHTQKSQKAKTPTNTNKKEEMLWQN